MAATAGGGGNGGTTSGDKNVEIIFGFGGSQSTGFQQSLKGFEQQSGIKIKFAEASQSFDTLIRSRVRANNRARHRAVPAARASSRTSQAGQDDRPVDPAGHQQAEVRAWSRACWTPATVDGKLYGVPVSMNIKSLVWYPKPAWAAKGYQVPKTQQELVDLTDKIKADGTTPWCMGMESAAATGWPATDWIEDRPARAGRPRHVRQVGQPRDPVQRPGGQEGRAGLRELVLADGNVLGGRKPTVSTAFATAANPMFDNPPSCFLHKQGNFITQAGFFPEGRAARHRQQGRRLPVPAGQPAATRRCSVAVTCAVLFNARTTTPSQGDEVPHRGPTSARRGRRGGGFLSPHKDFDAEPSTARD